MSVILWKQKPYGYICLWMNLSDVSSVWIKWSHNPQTYSLSCPFPGTVIIWNLFYSFPDILVFIQSSQMAPQKPFKTGWFVVIFHWRCYLPLNFIWKIFSSGATTELFSLSEPFDIKNYLIWYWQLFSSWRKKSQELKPLWFSSSNKTNVTHWLNF